MIFRGGRGFMTGWVGVILICFALTGIMICCCCWCANIFSKRRRDLDSLDSETGPAPSSPQLLKMLSQPEVIEARRQSSYSSPLPNDIIENALPMVQLPKQDERTFQFSSDRICPYPPAAGSAESATTNFVPMPMPYDGVSNPV